MRFLKRIAAIFLLWAFSSFAADVKNKALLKGSSDSLIPQEKIAPPIAGSPEIETALSLFAKEESYIYVFKADDSTALRVEILAEKESYLLPNNTETLLYFLGNVVAVIDNQYEIPFDVGETHRITLNYQKA